MMNSAQVILIVDDNFSDYEAAVRSLRKACIANPIMHCADGDDALDYLHRRGKFSDPASSPRPGVILLDLNLPGTDGKDILADIKHDPDLQMIPVVILTTSTDERDVQACYRMGANSYMKKRIDLQEFMAAIQRMSDFWLEIAILPREKS
ncbi:MAG TPA: response regulator [Solimonas sp.]|nr:response regulator [Solimonas sp.]